MARLRPVIALLLGAILLSGLGAQPAQATTIVENVGKIGTWVVSDSNTDAALRCAYAGTELATITVASPTIYGRARRKRNVGLTIEVLRHEWWREELDVWSVAYSSGLLIGRAKRAVPVSLAGMQWAVPEELRGPYEAFKVRMTIYWYAADRVRVVGQVAFELDYYGFQDEGKPFDPANVVGPAAACPGSTAQPTLPDAPPKDPPLGFPPMSHWVAFWKGWDEARVQATISDLRRMNQTGVVMMGLRWGNEYALPPAVSHYLTMFRDAGITPYLGLFVARFGNAEADTALRAWAAGDGQWAGVVLDVEAGFEREVQRSPNAAVAALDVFMARVRPVTPLMAYTSWGTLSSHPDLLYERFNSYCDIFMPQAYFRAGVRSAMLALDQIEMNIALETTGWAKPPIPMVPIVNDWGSGVNLDELSRYVNVSFQRYGAISGWRVHPNMREDVKDFWGTFGP